MAARRGDLRDDLLRLFDRACAETRDPQAINELEETLRSSPEAASAFLDYMAMHADLQSAVRLTRVREMVAGQITAPAAVVRPRLRRLALWAAPLFATAAALALLLTPPTTDQANNQADEFGRLRTDAVATINKSEGVALEGEPLDVGRMLFEGEEIAFDEGMIEIQFKQGAVVVLEGPAEFEASTINSGVLSAGKLAAVVPPWADGFRIDTPKLQVTDRGTQFAISVDDAKNVDVLVTKGMVEVATPTDDDQPADAPMMVLAGDAVRGDDAGVQPVGMDASLQELTSHLPERPDESQIEVVGRYQHDFVEGVPDQPRREGPWRYLTNGAGPMGRPESYHELLWDPHDYDEALGCYDANGTDPTSPGPLSVVKLRQGSGHPGWGSQQAADGIDRYAIAAFIVPEAGDYWLESGWIFRPENKPWRDDQAVDVLVHVDDLPPVITEDCVQDRFQQFRGPLGRLEKGAVVYVGIGPSEINYSDRFEWGFFIVREVD